MIKIYRKVYRALTSGRIRVMSNNDREKEIMNILEKKYSIRVKELAEMLYASEATIRRDIVKLEKQQLVIRSYGKIMANKLPPDSQIALSAREQLVYNIKRNLAETAATLVNDGAIIMLDASSTVSHLIKYLEKFKDIIVITCSIKTAYMLSQTNIKFICTGGEAINGSYSLVGENGINCVKKYNADICFVSCHGLSEDGLATDTSASENEIRYALIERSRQKVFLLDSTKINKSFWHNLCDISVFDTVICNEPLPEKIMARTKQFILS